MGLNLKVQKTFTKALDRIIAKAGPRPACDVRKDLISLKNLTEEGSLNLNFQTLFDRILLNHGEPEASADYFDGNDHDDVINLVTHWGMKYNTRQRKFKAKWIKQMILVTPRATPVQSQQSSDSE